LCLVLNGFSSTMMVLGIPIMSACVHAKMSALALRKFLSSQLGILSLLMVRVLLAFFVSSPSFANREYDFTMTKLRVSVLERGCSPIVISNETSPTNQERFPENPTRMVFVFTLVALMVGFSFSKQSSMITSALLTLVTGRNIIPSLQSMLSDMVDFFGLSKLSLRSLETPLVATSLASTQVDLLVFLQAQNLQGIIYVSGNEGAGTFVFLLFDVMHSQVCLCELLLLAKVRLELCFEIFVIKDATCFLTTPPYSRGVFE
nr:hypothetical protein [Tanacetum cinerariifolium]